MAGALVKPAQHLFGVSCRETPYRSMCPPGSRSDRRQTARKHRPELLAATNIVRPQRAFGMRDQGSALALATELRQPRSLPAAACPCRLAGLLVKVQLAQPDECRRSPISSPAK